PSAASAPSVDSAITPQIVRYPPALTPFARPCYSLATVRKEAHDGRPLGPLPSAAPPDDGRGRRRRGRRPRVVGGAHRPPRPGVGGAAGAVPVQRPRAKRTALVESLAQRFNQAQKDFEVKVEFVPQAQAAQKLVPSSR